MRSEHTISNYLLLRTDIISMIIHSGDSEELFSESIIVSRVLFLKNHHYFTDNILRPLAEAALVGIRLKASHHKHIRMYIVMGSHVFDNLEFADFLAVRCRIQTDSFVLSLPAF